MHARRAARVAEALRQELAEIIGFEMTDPRVAGVTVTRVAVSRDLRRADVRVRAEGDEVRQEIALRALEGARHWIRRELAGRLRIWRIPEFHFQADSEAGKPEDGPEAGGGLFEPR